MSLKKSIRTAQKVTRTIDKAQKDHQRTEKAFRDIEAQLKKRPVTALNVRYDPEIGLLSDKIEFRTAAGSREYGIEDSPPACVASEPATQTVNGVSIRPLDMLISRWATLVPLEVANDNHEFRPNVNWIKKSDRSSSAIFLLDPDNGEYYYPVETSLTGEVVTGHPRTGVFAFDPFRVPTSRAQLHLSGVRLGPARSPAAQTSLTFVLSKPSLRDDLENVLSGPSVSESLQAAYDEQVGCSVAAFLLASGALTIGGTIAHAVLA